jgi:hypothetical protein
MSLFSQLFLNLKGKIKRGKKKSGERLVSGTEIGERIKVYDLICPLRYDIQIRGEFIRFLAENSYLSEDDVDVILEAPAAQRYQTWYRDIAYRRRNPAHSHDENHFREHFRKRVRNVQELWKSMSTKGFDYSHPIRLKSGEVIREVNGKSFETRFYAGDGCHRIACLLIMGKEVLEPKEYEVIISQEFSPLDNTAVLLDKLSISMSDYLSFISQGYCGGHKIESAEQALAYVERLCPNRLEELKNVFRYDLGRI